MNKKKHVEFIDTIAENGKEYVSRDELELNYDLRPSKKLFTVNKETGERVRVPDYWRRMLRIDWMVMLVVAIIVFSFFMYQGSIAEYKSVALNPCKYCSGIVLPNGLNNEFVFNSSVLSNISVNSTG